MEAGRKKNSRCTDEADRELVKRYQDGDERAFVSLLDVHIGLIWHWVRTVRDQASWANPDDLLQEGRIGLWETANKFDVSRKGNFDAWARKACIGRMFDSSEVRLLKRVLSEHRRKVREAENRLMKELNRRPTLEELAEATGLSVNQVETALDAEAAFMSPLDDADGAVTKDDSYQKQLIADALNQLTPDQVEVIIRHHYLQHKLTKIAKDLGKSEDAVKQLHKRAKEKLHAIIYGKGKRKDGI
jgi:RNA polymerase sigma factor (sigma-70 family)